MPRHLTAQPNLVAIIVQHKRDRYKRDCQKPQQTARPCDPQLRVHGVREERKRRPEPGPHQIVACINGRHILWVRIAQVAKDGHEEQERAYREEGCADDGHDPMNRRARRPAEPEQADGDEERPDHGRLETNFGPEFAILIELGLDEDVIVVEKGDQDDEGTEEDAEEGQAFEALGEVVDIDEDDWERLEPEVEETVGEGDVEIEYEDNGFLQGESEGPDEDHEEDFLRGHAFGFELWLTFDVNVAGRLADVDSAAVENVA